MRKNYIRVDEIRVLPRAGKAAIVEINVALLERPQLPLLFVLYMYMKNLLLLLILIL